MGHAGAGTSPCTTSCRPLVALVARRSPPRPLLRPPPPHAPLCPPGTAQTRAGAPKAPQRFPVIPCRPAIRSTPRRCSSTCSSSSRCSSSRCRRRHRSRRRCSSNRSSSRRSNISSSSSSSSSSSMFVFPGSLCSLFHAYQPPLAISRLGRVGCRLDQGLPRGRR